MTNSQHFDVIIIGTGAGGGTLAYKLAPSGKRILLLERGGYLPREQDNWNSRAVVKDAKYNTTETWRDKNGKELHPHTNYYVGGNTKFYGAALFRLREQDFGELKHHGGISPAWPISYAELEPYYTQAEHLYHVHGQRGEDPTDPWASAPYLHPAVSHEPRIQKLVEDLQRLGHQPFHVPLGVMLDERQPNKSKCIRCAYTPNNLEGHKRLYAKVKELVKEADCHEHLIPLNAFVGDRLPLAAVAHQNGTIRFGNGPQTSALNAQCRAHEVDNLYVVDGSFFPSSAAVNPALTIMANALRVGEHLLERLG